MNYGKKMWRQAGPAATVLVACNLYFFFFIQERTVGYLVYLDILLLVPAFLWLILDYLGYRQREKRKEELFKQDVIACRVVEDFENRDIAVHDVEVLERQLNEQVQENRDLQDYAARWCHEVKLPLAAAFLIQEKIGDAALRTSMREQLEKIRLRLNSMLSGCRLQSSLLDLQIRETDLAECVRTSIRNNRFFLIQKRFDLTVEVGEHIVYTDPSWLVYILDQLLGNAAKYGQRPPGGGEISSPMLHIWSGQEGEVTRLFVEDRGQGIRPEDLGRIFEKGFTGRNYHNGKYRSTGMGLYLAARIAGRLGHEIVAESEYGEYSRFCVVMRQNGYYGVLGEGKGTVM